MGTQEMPSAKKASNSDPAVHKLVAKHKASARSPRLTLQTNSQGPKSTLRPTKSPHFSPPTPIPKPVRTSKTWQAWEQQLSVSLRTIGKTYGEISQKLPGRSTEACRRKWRVVNHFSKWRSSRKNSKQREVIERLGRSNRH